MSTRLISLGLSGFLIAVPASAQVTFTNFGFKGGLNLSDFYGTEIGEAERKQGKLFGAFLQIDLGGALVLQPELYYTERGAEEAEIFNEEVGAVTDWVWRYDYLDFVPLLKLRVNSKRSSPSFSLFTGPILSFRVGAKGTGLKGTVFTCCPPQRVPGSSPFVSPLEQSTKGSDVGGTVGVDIEIDVGPTRLAFDARYTRMMREFDRGPSDGLYSRKHSAFPFQVGVSLNPSAWARGRSRRPSVVPRAPPRNTIIIMELITREDIAARDETLSVYDIIRLERPHWIDGGGGEVRATLFVDGEPWDGSPRILRDRRGAEVEEIRRFGAGAGGVYLGHGVVVEIITRGGS